MPFTYGILLKILVVLRHVVMMGILQQFGDGTGHCPWIPIGHHLIEHGHLRGVQQARLQHIRRKGALLLLQRQWLATGLRRRRGLDGRRPRLLGLFLRLLLRRLHLLRHRDHVHARAGGGADDDAGRELVSAAGAADNDGHGRRAGQAETVLLLLLLLLLLRGL